MRPVRTSSDSRSVCGPACAAVRLEPEPGWQQLLERQIGASETWPANALALPAVDEDPAAGDAVRLAITLEDGERTRSWQLAVEVVAVAGQRVLDGRSVQPFELRVQPGEARRRQMEKASAAWREQIRANGWNLVDLVEDRPVARIRVEALDASGASVGTAESSAIVRQLRSGLLPAARAGYRQRELMRGRVEQGGADAHR